jgi:hypothetical protein
MTIDPGRLPGRQLIRAAQQAERDADVRAERRARMFPGGAPPRGLRRLRERLRRLRHRDE